MKLENLNIRSLPIITLGQDQRRSLVSSANGNNPQQTGGLDVQFEFIEIPSTVRIATIQEVLSHELLVETTSGEARYSSASVLKDGKGGMFYDFFDFNNAKWTMNGGEPVASPVFRDAPFKGLESWWVRHQFNIQFRLWFCIVTSQGVIEEPLGSFKWDLGWSVVNNGDWAMEQSHTSQVKSIRESLVIGGDIEVVRSVVASPDVKRETREFYATLEVPPTL